MLFSNPTVANYINENFEASWESVRPVPRVTIDFGNGNVINRTLHGNVATYICNSNQSVVDILPGVYTADVYVEQLKLIRSVAKPELIDVLPSIVEIKGASTETHVERYHRTKIEAIENQNKLLDSTIEPMQAGSVSADTDADSADQKLARNLVIDTKTNEQQRRRQVHRHLLAYGAKTPAEIKTWLYREVLHADLEDPFLGLKPVLFDNYPFDD